METTAIPATGTPTTTTGAENASDTTRSLANLAENFDNFLTILTAQLQHQDPLSPLDSNEFTSQLVQFTGVEQQVLQNKKLDSLIDLQAQGQSVAAVSYIGKIIEASGNTNLLTGGEATFSYLLPETATAAAIRILNSDGEIVFQQPVETSAGLHDIVWDGSNLQGGTEPDGVYSFAVSAVDADDVPINVTHSVIGRVTGLSFNDGKTVLGIGEVGVPLEVVTGIQESPNSADQSG